MNLGADVMAWNEKEPIVSLKDVWKSFASTAVLRGISFDVMKGDVICIIGPSGSGKSTVLRCINALVTIDKGSITVKGQEVHDSRTDKLALRKKVGMVFQQYNLFPHKTALENIMLAPVHVLRQPKDQAEENARRLLAKVSPFRKRRCLSWRTLWRPATKGGYCALACHDAGRHAL